MLLNSSILFEIPAVVIPPIAINEEPTLFIVKYDLATFMLEASVQLPSSFL